VDAFVRSDEQEQQGTSNSEGAVVVAVPDTVVAGSKRKCRKR
jgi:hypothetical protein